jgi:hypothetical protein
MRGRYHGASMGVYGAILPGAARLALRHNPRAVRRDGRPGAGRCQESEGDDQQGENASVQHGRTPFVCLPRG